MLVGLLAGAGWVLAGFGAAWLLAHPGRSHADPRLAGFEDVSLQAADGVRLAAWYARPEGEPLGTLLVLHEREGHRSIERLRFAVERGWAAFALDFRGCGDSDDAVTGFGWHERLDVDAALTWIEARRRADGDDGPVVGWGRSLGAAALVYALDPRRDPPAPGAVDGLVLESLYRDIDTAFRNRVRHHLPLPGHVADALLTPVPLAAELVSGIRRDDLRPIEVLPLLMERPLLLAGGRLDPLCTPAELSALVRAAPQVHAVELDAAHDDFMRLRRWREELAWFLKGLASR